MKPIVVDASVAAKWFLPEDDSDRAVRLLTKRYHLVAPDLLWSEFGNILWKLARRDLLAGDEVETILDDFLAMPVEFHPGEALLPAAMQVALAAGVTVYDGMYVALAFRHDTVCVTADERLVHALSQTPFSENVRPLGR